MPRRSFLAAVGGTAVGSAALAGCATTTATRIKSGDRPRPAVAKKELVVQPVLCYWIPKRAEQTSWRGWGGIQTEADLEVECKRINDELEAMKAKSEFPLTFLPLAKVTSMEQASALRAGAQDLMLIYAATGGGDAIEKMIDPQKYTIMFVRHKSGPVSVWYETASCRMLRKTVDELGQPGLMPCDVVVDDINDVVWRMRAVFALKNTLQSRILAIGDASGWGEGGQKAPKIAAEKWKLDIVPVSYDDLGKRIVAARADAALMKKAAEDAEAYLKDGGVTLNTDKGFVSRAFVLTEVFRDLMAEMNSNAITVNNCMSTIMPMSETTACLPLTLINDAGALAFCESDFVVIPSGILLNHICQTPVFLNDPTYPHHGVITLAHCTAPRKMDGRHSEKVNILTHFESDYGAAPKVDMRIGQEVTCIDPSFDSSRWIGFRGRIVDNPFLDVCRSQIDVAIDGDCDKLAEIMCGFHWMTSYGDHRKELAYALRKMGVEWIDLTAEQEKRA